MSRELNIIKFRPKLFLLGFASISFCVFSSVEQSDGLTVAIINQIELPKPASLTMAEQRVSSGFYHMKQGTGVSSLPNKNEYLYSNGDLLDLEGQRWLAINDEMLKGNKIWLNRQGLLTAKLANFKTIVCTGTEPYWRISIEGGHINHDIADIQTPYALVSVVESFNHNNQWWLKGKRSSLPELDIVLKKSSQCSDDMSEQIFDFEVSLIVGDQAYSGCCS